MFNNIPEELKQLSQFVVWRYETKNEDGKATKIPYCPHTGYPASVVNPASWSNFATACDAFNRAQGQLAGIGFVLTKEDPYTCIDLDNPFELDKNGNRKFANPHEILDRQIKVHDAFDCYSERSPSGTGLHIWCKAAVPTGRRRLAIEVYSEGRYMTMTGDVFNAKPIESRQEYASFLWAEMEGKTSLAVQYEGDLIEKYTDAQVIRMACDASNGEKFKSLGRGEFAEWYESQSQADFAFINILAFYTQNRDQIKRIFRSCVLGQRPKAQREKYVNDMINYSFDRMLPPVDIAGLKAQMQRVLDGKALATPKPAPKPAPKPQPAPSPYTFPPGIIGEIAQFIFDQSPYPAKEMALAGALAFMSGVCGKSYNVYGTGINNYFVLLAETGRGKEAMAKGIDRILEKVKPNIKDCEKFLGPSRFGSPPAMIKHLADSPSFMSIFGEFAVFLKELINPHANENKEGLYRLFLDLYNKSGHCQTVGSIVYSDRDKNTKTLKGPAFSLLGECTPERYFALLDEMVLDGGLLPRFITIPFFEDRCLFNKNSVTIQPTEELILWVSQVCSHSLMLINNDRVIDVIPDKESEEILNHFNDVTCRAFINSTGINSNIHKNIWTRSHVKVLKLSALVAIGINPYHPVITKDCVEWAKDIVVRDNKFIISKFENGEIGSLTTDYSQTKECFRVIKDYVLESFEHLKKYKVPEDMHRMGIVPYAYLNKRLSPLACFRTDKMGATNAMKRALQALMDSGEIQEIPKGQMEREFKTAARGFAFRGNLA